MSSMSVLKVRVPANKVDEVLDYYVSEGILEASNASSSQLMVDEDNPGTIIVTALWEDPEAYAQWGKNPKRKEHEQGLYKIAGKDASGESAVLKVAHQI